MFSFCTVNLRLHACGDILTEHPKLHALAHQHPIHEDSRITFFWYTVVHELRKIDVRCNRQIVLVYGKAAVSLGVLDIPLRISGVRRADIHNGSEGGSLADCLFFLFQTGERLVFCRAEIALCVVLICLGMTAKQFRVLHGIEKKTSIRPYLTQEQINMLEVLQKADIGLLLSVPDFQTRKRHLEWYAERIKKEHGNGRYG